MTDPRILLVNTKLGNLNHYLTHFVQEGLEQVLGAGSVVASDYHRCIDDYQRHDCNAVVCLDGQELQAPLIAKLRRIAPRMALWLTEDPYEQSTNQRHLPLFDVVFTNDRRSVAFYGAAKVEHLPLAASPTHHRHRVVTDDNDYLYDVFFAGTAWPNRVALLRRLVAELKGCRCKLILPYNEFLERPDLGLPEFETHYRLSNKDLAVIQNRSKVVLHLHRDFSASGVTQKSSTPGPRVFETALAGGFQLAEDMLPEMDDYFARGREMAYFRTAEECIERIRHYLEHDDERRDVARAAQQRCERDHLYSRRAERIVERLQGVAPRVAAEAVSGRPTTVMYVVHNSPRKPPFGGCELHTQTTLESLSPRYNGLLYYADRDVPGWKHMVLHRDGIEKPRLLATDFDERRFFDLERESHFGDLLERERVDIVHFMHFLHHPFSLIETARRHGVKTVVTLHDYYAVCPRFTLLDGAGRFCWHEPPPLATCDIDLKRTAHMEPGSQAARRAMVAHALSLADAVTCVSQSQWEIVRSAYPHLEAKTRIINPGIQPELFQRVGLPPRNGRRPLRVVAIGNFTHPKGADSLIYLFDHFRHDDRFKFTVAGRIDHPFSDIVKQVGLHDVAFLGNYQPADLPRILADADVALIASIWAETFVLTLSECWAAGVVPVVSDIGALRERVIDGVNGLKAPADSPGHMAVALERLADEPGLLERLRDPANRGATPSVAEATGEYERLYEELMRGRAGWSRASAAAAIVPFPPIPCSSRRLHAQWARTTPERKPLTPGAGPPVSLPRKVVRYCRKHGLRNTARRAVLRLMGRP